MQSLQTRRATAPAAASRAAAARPQPPARRRAAAVAADARMQFIRGVDEPTVPEVSLRRARTGTSGAAMMLFESPSIFQASGELGEITGLFMIDDEGELSTTDVKAKFVNGKPQAIEAKYTMRSQFEWERFIRFMDRPTAAQPPAPDLQRAQRRVRSAPGGQPQQQQPQQQPVAARLRALALREIDPPPGGEALAEAGCTAMLEAQRAAKALGLEPALFDDVCCGMQQAVGGGGARLFLAGDYPSLRYACSAGDAAVARKWMARMAARGGGGGGGG
ncbi:photosystem II reaction center protein PSB28 [Raphidocelis subcapitata]|uniref:Photosystem II reaction center Psb28 protein n=1 Tax=Raphidocelis subcapitata TaxID=307507 RepID=A0A2V0NQS6_9CHLO|nr:photosystem II reaction center protein PSB28 [Raphidocelis subcapitata]|eukprot:GBF89649.1 photosystem II reaction center protein PSB28 [Raphidocelis subcapitata]